MKLSKAKAARLGGKAKECKDHEYTQCEQKECQAIYCSTCSPNECPYCMIYGGQEK